MKDRYLFKAKRQDNNEWVYGSLISNVNKTGRYFIVENDVYAYKNDDETINQIIEDKVEVIRETICEYTGLDDMNGKKIFKNDIVEEGCNGLISSVTWDNEIGTYKLEVLGDYYIKDAPIEWEVIGNKFDNPELLDKEVKDSE